MAFAGESFVCIVGENGELPVSRDGGRSWANIDYGITVDLWSVAFTDSLHGWIGGDSGLVLRSVDGSTSWARHSLPSCGRVRDICAFGKDTVWACGEDTLARTTDAGESWSQRQLPIGSTGFHCLNGTVAWVGTRYGDLYRTTDGGVSWTSLWNSGNFESMHQIHFHDTMTGLLSVEQHSLARTTDGGQTWKTINIDTARSDLGAYDIEEVSHSTLYVFPSIWNGTVYSSDDSGATWSAYFSAETNVIGYVYDFGVDSTGHLWLTGADGLAATTRPEQSAVAPRPFVRAECRRAGAQWRLRTDDSHGGRRCPGYTIAGRHVVAPQAHSVWSGLIVRR